MGHDGICLNNARQGSFVWRSFNLPFEALLSTARCVLLAKIGQKATGPGQVRMAGASVGAVWSLRKVEAHQVRLGTGPSFIGVSWPSAAQPSGMGRTNCGGGFRVVQAACGTAFVVATVFSGPFCRVVPRLVGPARLDSKVGYLEGSTDCTSIMGCGQYVPAGVAGAVLSSSREASGAAYQCIDYAGLFVPRLVVCCMGELPQTWCRPMRVLFALLSGPPPSSGPALAALPSQGCSLASSIALVLLRSSLLEHVIYMHTSSGAAIIVVQQCLRGYQFVEAKCARWVKLRCQQKAYLQPSACSRCLPPPWGSQHSRLTCATVVHVWRPAVVQLTAPPSQQSV